MTAILIQSIKALAARPETPGCPEPEATCGACDICAAPWHNLVATCSAMARHMQPTGRGQHPATPLLLPTAAAGPGGGGSRTSTPGRQAAAAALLQQIHSSKCLH